MSSQIHVKLINNFNTHEQCVWGPDHEHLCYQISDIMSITEHTNISVEMAVVVAVLLYTLLQGIVVI